MNTMKGHSGDHVTASQCDQCDETKSWRYLIEKHEQYELHKKIRYECCYCNYSAKTKYRMDQHLESHKASKQQVWGVTGKSYKCIKQTLEEKEKQK